MTDSTNEAAVLVIAAFGKRVNGRARPGKVYTHLEAIDRAVDRVTYVTPGPPANTSPGIEYRRVPPTRFRPLRLLLQWVIVLKLAHQEDYDLIISFSLLPYGLFALTAKAISATPAHLGIIGIDLDVHAASWYGGIVQAAFRQFDVVTVAGTDHRRRLIATGVEPDRAVSVLHPVAPRYSSVSPVASPTWDALWIGRFSEEKDPIAFVDAIAACHATGNRLSAVMVGRGSLESAVDRAIQQHGLEDHIDRPGWIADPVDIYREAKLLVVTSHREMLPLTIVEAMSVGLPVVSPPIGGIPDVVEDGHSGILVPDRSPTSFAAGIRGILDQYDQYAEQAGSVSDRLNADTEADAWRIVVARAAAPTT